MPFAQLGKGKTWTYLLTNDSLVIAYGDQVKKVSIANNSAVDGSVIGGSGFTIGGFPSTSVPIAQGEGLTVTPADIAVVLDDITITAPLGCTLKIVAQLH